MKKNTFSNILTFLLIFLVLNFAFNYFFKPEANNDIPQKSEVILSLSKNEYNLHDLTEAIIQNNTGSTVTIKNRCPSEPLEVLTYNNGQWVKKTTQAKISCEGSGDIVILPGAKTNLAFTSWNHALFGETGRYKLQTSILIEGSPNPVGSTGTPNTPEQKIIETPEFEIKPEGLFHSLWIMTFYQPIYNILILLLSITPGKDLGFAIILLTIVIRTILLIPSQNALKAQRKMQEIQPKLNKIKEKYKDNQEMMGKETMAILKENKANPLGSCLPVVIQIPILIALFYVIRDGLNPDNAYLLYGFLKNFSFENINVNFLSILDLTKANILILPIIVGVLQFFQMRLATVATRKIKQESSENKPATKDKKSEMEIANNMMMYVMPIVIAVFTSSVPAGVGIYYSTSTIYGIFQQLVVNKQGASGNVKVKVIS